MANVGFVSNVKKDPFEALRNEIDRLFEFPLASEAAPDVKEATTALSADVSGSEWNDEK